MGTDNFSNTAEAFEAFDDIPLSPPRDDTIGAVIARRYSRRDMLKASLGVTAATALFGTAALSSARRAGGRRRRAAAFDFGELPSGIDETHHVAEGYEADVLIRWGDPLFSGTAVRSPEAHRRGAGAALWLQLRLPRLLPAEPPRHPRPPLRESRVRQSRGDVRWRRHSTRPERFRQDHRSPRRRGNGRAWRQRRRDRPR